MPFITGKDPKGQFIHWGEHGKKYYFRTVEEFKNAHAKANKQRLAIAYSEAKKI
jgi:hypothetical protein